MTFITGSGAELSTGVSAAIAAGWIISAATIEAVVARHSQRQ
jgi:hypothetical protein